MKNAFCRLLRAAMNQRMFGSVLPSRKEHPPNLLQLLLKRLLSQFGSEKFAPSAHPLDAAMSFAFNLAVTHYGR